MSSRIENEIQIDQIESFLNQEKFDSENRFVKLKLIDESEIVLERIIQKNHFGHKKFVMDDIDSIEYDSHSFLEFDFIDSLEFLKKSKSEKLIFRSVIQKF